MTPQEKAITKQNIYPVLRYVDLGPAIAWLGRVFSFEKLMVVDDADGNPQFATMTYEGGTIMISSTPIKDRSLTSPKSLGSATAAVHVYVKDLEEHYRRSMAEGAEIMKPLGDSSYGTRGYSARDLESHPWTFSSYQP